MNSADGLGATILVGLVSIAEEVTESQERQQTEQMKAQIAAITTTNSQSIPTQTSS